MNQTLRFAKTFSTKIIPKGWVKFNGNPAIRVTTTDCDYITDFIKNIKRELPRQLSSFDCNEIPLHNSETSTQLSPGVSISEALKNNSVETPLYVKVLQQAPLSSHILSKTIFIQDIDDECRPIDSFTKVVVENEADLKQIYGGKGEALYLLSNPKDRVTKFKQLIEGETYNVYSRYEKSFADEVRWQQVEDKAMEEETLLDMKSFLINHLGPSVIEMPTDIMGSEGKTIVQEWDAVFKVDDVMYLCEAKHNMTFQQVVKTFERIQKFKGFKMNAQAEFRQADKIVGVLCGTLFPADVRKSAHISEFICVYPSGNRYGVESPPKEFVIER